MTDLTPTKGKWEEEQEEGTGLGVAIPNPIGNFGHIHL